jgi:hypothetical protein
MHTAAIGNHVIFYQKKWQTCYLVKNFVIIHPYVRTGQRLTVMRNQTIIIPFILKERVKAIAPEGYQSITKTKSLLRTKVWFLR